MIEPWPNARSIWVSAPLSADSRALAAFSCSFSIACVSSNLWNQQARCGSGRNGDPIATIQRRPSNVSVARAPALPERHPRKRLVEGPLRAQGRAVEGQLGGLERRRQRVRLERRGPRVPLDARQGHVRPEGPL